MSLIRVTGSKPTGFARPVHPCLLAPSCFLCDARNQTQASGCPVHRGREGGCCPSTGGPEANSYVCLSGASFSLAPSCFLCDGRSQTLACWRPLHRGREGGCCPSTGDRRQTLVFASPVHHFRQHLVARCAMTGARPRRLGDRCIEAVREAVVPQSGDRNQAHGACSSGAPLFVST